MITFRSNSLNGFPKHLIIFLINKIQDYGFSFLSLVFRNIPIARPSEADQYQLLSTPKQEDPPFQAHLVQRMNLKPTWAT